MWEWSSWFRHNIHSGLNVSDVTGFNSGLNVGLLGVIELVVLKVETVDEAQMTLLP